jgi:hypothetical protein
MPGGLQGFPGDVNIQGNLFVQGAITVGINGSIVPTFPLLAPNGTAAVPSYSFTNSPATGLYSSGVNSFDISIAGVRTFAYNNIGIIATLVDTCGFIWGAGQDIGMRRNAAGVLEINNANAGTFRDLILRNIGLNGNVPPVQKTGFGTPTGTGVIANFPGATATLAQCSQAIAELITDLKALGLYGA